MAEEKQYISRIKLTDGTTVDLKDAEARLQLESLLSDDGQVTINKQDIEDLLEQIQWGEF